MNERKNTSNHLTNAQTFRLTDAIRSRLENRSTDKLKDKETAERFFSTTLDFPVTWYNIVGSLKILERNPQELIAEPPKPSVVHSMANKIAALEAKVRELEIAVKAITEALK